MAIGNRGGRPPKPTALKILEGNPGRRPLNDAEPVPPSGEVRPPSWLKGRGRRAWREVVPILKGMGVLTTADPQALALLCDAYAEYINARGIIGEKGMTYDEGQIIDDGKETGVVVTAVKTRARPEVAIASDAWKRVRVMLVEFGMTPSSRSRIHVSKPEEKVNPFEEFLGHRTS